MVTISLILQFLSLVGAGLSVRFSTKTVSLSVFAVSVLSIVFGVVGSSTGEVKITEFIKDAWDPSVPPPHPTPGWSFGVYMGAQAAYCIIAGLHFVDSRSKPR